MHFDGQFRVPGAPGDVLSRFADVERMARCMPGAAIDGRDDDGLYIGHMLIAFGPKQIKFKGKVRAATYPDRLAGELHIRGAADMKTAARVEVHITYTLLADHVAASPVTVVSMASEAQMGGVLADFARTGGVVVTRALMDQFAARAAKEFAEDLPAAPRENRDQPKTGPATAPAALAAHVLLWYILKARLAAMATWLRLRGKAG